MLGSAARSQGARVRQGRAARSEPRVKRQRAGVHTGSCDGAVVVAEDSGATQVDFKVELVWLDAAPDNRYLLLIDQDTGDVMTLLQYAAELFGDNYSRKLSNPKFSSISLPADHQLAPQLHGMCWRPAFESPRHVKARIKGLLHDMAPGHVRLVLLPVLYNTMAGRPELQQTPLFQALHAAIMASSYAPLVHAHASAASAGGHLAGTSTRSSRLSCKEPRASQRASLQQVFQGPQELSMTQAKYMLSYKELMRSKRPRNSQAEPGHSMEAVFDLMHGLFERLEAVSDRLDIAEEDRSFQRAELTEMRGMVASLLSNDSSPAARPAKVPVLQAMPLHAANQTELPQLLLDTLPDCSQDSNESAATFQETQRGIGALQPLGLAHLPVIDRESCTPELEAPVGREHSCRLSLEDQELLDSVSRLPFNLAPLTTPISNEPPSWAHRSSLYQSSLQTGMNMTPAATRGEMPGTDLTLADLYSKDTIGPHSAYPSAQQMPPMQDLDPRMEHNAEMYSFYLP